MLGSFCAAFFTETRSEFIFPGSWRFKNEQRYFHWIRNRAVRDLEAEGTILSERRTLSSGGTIKLVWHKKFRYYKREASRVIDLVNQYSDPNIGAALGLQGEALILEGFARIEFVMKGRDAKHYGGRVWIQTDHDVDFVFEREWASVRHRSQEYAWLYGSNGV